MEWSDDGIVLAARKHGETSAIVSLLTRGHGRHVGLVRGGAGRRARGIYQPGNRVHAAWRARLAEHLGAYRCELVRAYAADHLQSKLPLMGLSAATAMAEATLPEREPHAALFDRLVALLDALAAPGWAAAYVRWELALLSDLGFGLDLSECAATGTGDGLVYVSPRSGRAVSAAAGAPWRERLLPLPGFLLPGADGTSPDGMGADGMGPDVDEAPPDAGDIAGGLELTGYFFAHHVFTTGRGGLPAARRRLAEGLQTV